MRAIDLISPAYRDEQRRLHAQPEGYGGKGAKWRDEVLRVAASLNAFSILDYGCGQGSLGSAVRGQGHGVIRVDEYDPAIKGKDAPPMFADLVTCTDVLEHIEPDRLATVLAHLKMLARKAVFVVIATRPSNKFLSDGRNAHLILESADWWHARVLAAGFTVSNIIPVSPSVKPSREWTAVLIP